MKDVTVEVTNGSGRAVRVSPVVEAMIQLLVQADDEIRDHREGSVELHYVSATGKVSGKLRHHVGLERF